MKYGTADVLHVAKMLHHYAAGTRQVWLIVMAFIYVQIGLHMKNQEYYFVCLIVIVPIARLWRIKSCYFITMFVQSYQMIQLMFH